MNCHLYRKRKLVLNSCSRETWQRGGDVWNWGVTIVFRVISHYRWDTYIILLCRKHQGGKKPKFISMEKECWQHEAMEEWETEPISELIMGCWAAIMMTGFSSGEWTPGASHLRAPLWELPCLLSSVAHLSWAWREGLFWTCIAFIACLWLLLVQRPNKCSWN